jgi:hypothetical protein
MTRALPFAMALAAASPALAIDVDYATYGGHPYAFVNEWLTWEEADSLCASAGAHLAVVDDGAELLFLLRSVHAGPRYNDSNDSWIGASAIGPFANEYESGLIFTYPWDRTIETAFWYRPSEFARHKAICELF